MAEEKMFPVLWSANDVEKWPALGCPRHIPWRLLAPFDAQAKKNHDQSLERLASRGGLSPAEIMCIIEGRGLWEQPMRKDIEEIPRLVAWLATKNCKCSCHDPLAVIFAHPPAFCPKCVPGWRERWDGMTASPSARCGCGEAKCRGVEDDEHHQCGGPAEACVVPGCPVCRTPVDAPMPGDDAEIRRLARKYDAGKIDGAAYAAFSHPSVRRLVEAARVAEKVLERIMASGAPLDFERIGINNAWREIRAAVEHLS